MDYEPRRSKGGSELFGVGGGYSGRSHFPLLIKIKKLFAMRNTYEGLTEGLERKKEINKPRIKI